MAGLFLGNRKGHYFYGIDIKNANVRLRFANRTYELPAGALVQMDAVMSNAESTPPQV
ncbi:MULTISPECIES: hypothetical protein [unclassified Aeromonas]|uniref:hypothetical protein n=1 Tax=unclassified Aeromonas TaxID=257493 RepID=UPI003529AF07